MSRILLFLSTGRCGTQLLTDLLAQSAGDRAVVAHEPLRAGYRPRECLRMPDPAARLRRLPDVERHFRAWDEHLAQGRAVIETGWPIFPWLPYLATRYPGALDVVHLIRDPVRTAFSMASHQYYSPQRQDDYVRWAALCPTDPGVRLGEYVALWPRLNRVERCLYHWAEVHRFAEELAASGRVSTQLRGESLFADPQGFVAQIRAIDPAWRAVLAAPCSAEAVVDRYHWPLDAGIDGLRYTESVAEIARRQGYAIDVDRQRDALITRFFKSTAVGG